MDFRRCAAPALDADIDNLSGLLVSAGNDRRIVFAALDFLRTYVVGFN
jgi:hypothetical protein